jgi:RNA-directed DNA polymerase
LSETDQENLSLFERICEPLNVTEAYYRARKGIKRKSEANAVEARLEHEMHEISGRLRRHEYNFGGYQIMLVRDPKDRKILVAPFRDRIVHHAINAHIAPIFERSFIHDTYACLKGRGNQKALHRLQRWLDGQPDTFVLKMDIKQYFASIRRDILFKIVQKKIADPDVVRLLERLIMTAPTDGYEGCGVPIGNLTSQTFANAYLDVLDHYVKDKLGVRNYLRYVDDFVCLGDKKTLHELRKKIVAFLHEHLDLKVDPTKNRVLYAKNGLPFLGFVLRPNRQARLRKQAVKRFFWGLRRAKRDGLSEPEMAMKVVSWYAYARRANVHALLNKTDTMKYVDQIL